MRNLLDGFQLSLDEFLSQELFARSATTKSISALLAVATVDANFVSVKQVNGLRVTGFANADNERLAKARQLGGCTYWMMRVKTFSATEFMPR